MAPFALCLPLLALFPLSLQVPLPQGCCYWDLILEIKGHLNHSSALQDPELYGILMNRNLLKSNLAVFLNATETLFNSSSSTIGKNLRRLEEHLQNSSIPTPAPEEKLVYVLARDFDAFSRNLNVFLEVVDDVLRTLLVCPPTSCRRPPQS